MLNAGIVAEKKGSDQKGTALSDSFIISRHPFGGVLLPRISRMHANNNKQEAAHPLQ